MDAPAASAPPQPLFAEPSPLGLLGLAIGCAALLPIAFGVTLTPAALRMAAWFCLLFGGGCQFLAGMMSLANKNLLGGTLFTTFAFNWVMNYVTLAGIAEGKLPDPHVGFYVDVCFLLIFAVLTFAFGFYSKLLFAFLLDIDVLYALRIVKEIAREHSNPLQPSMATKVVALCQPLLAWTTVVLTGIALWLALGVLVNHAAGRTVIPMPGPMFKPSTAAG